MKRPMCELRHLLVGTQSLARGAAVLQPDHRAGPSRPSLKVSTGTGCGCADALMQPSSTSNKDGKSCTFAADAPDHRMASAWYFDYQGPILALHSQSTILLPFGRLVHLRQTYATCHLCFWSICCTAMKPGSWGDSALIVPVR